MLNYVAVFINLCTTIFYKIYELFQYKSQESKFDIAIDKLKVSQRTSLEPSWIKISKLSMKSYVLAFCHFWTCNRSKSTQGHYLNYRGRTQVPCFKAIGSLIPEPKNFQGSTIYWHGRGFGHVAWTIHTTYIPSVPEGSALNLVTIDPVASKVTLKIVIQ